MFKHYRISAYVATIRRTMCAMTNFMSCFYLSPLWLAVGGCATVVVQTSTMTA